MTSFVRFFGLKAITISAALSMTAGLAFAGDNNPSTNAIVNSLKAPALTRSLSVDPQRAADNSFINSVRNRSTRSLSMGERNQLDTIAASRPKIDWRSISTSIRLRSAKPRCRPRNISVRR